MGVELAKRWTMKKSNMNKMSLEQVVQSMSFIWIILSLILVFAFQLINLLLILEVKLGGHS
jgi:beta-lactamase regulating signal transducer with metallopeptidase domain